MRTLIHFFDTYPWHKPFFDSRKHFGDYWKSRSYNCRENEQFHSFHLQLNLFSFQIRCFNETCSLSLQNKQTGWRSVEKNSQYVYGYGNGGGKYEIVKRNIKASIRHLVEVCFEAENGGTLEFSYRSCSVGLIASTTKGYAYPLESKNIYKYKYVKTDNLF